MYKSVTDKAKEIRARLKKELNANSKKVSVRSDKFSGGSSIDVYIKDLTLDIEAVKKIAYEYKTVRRCEYSGEILSGGNCYIDVKYDSTVISEGSQEFMTVAKELMPKRNDYTYLDPNEEVLLTNETIEYKEKKFSAYNEYRIAEALFMLNIQYGINIDTKNDVGFEW